MPQSKEVHTEYMRKRRGSQIKGSQMEGSQGYIAKGSQDIVQGVENPVNILGLAHIDKGKLNSILNAFESSSHPEYTRDVRLGIEGPTFYDIGQL